INVAFKRHEARRLAAEALAYIHAWDVVRMMAHRQQAGQPIPYLLTAAGGGDAAGVSELSKRLSPGRPVTRKDVGKTNGAAAKPAQGKSSASGPALTDPLPPETAVSPSAALQ
ncbi:MAG: hypothetical protein R6X34_06090, partial [Chloroflexota bacterium]